MAMNEHFDYFYKSQMRGRNESEYFVEERNWRTSEHDNDNMIMVMVLLPSGNDDEQTNGNRMRRFTLSFLRVKW